VIETESKDSKDSWRWFIHNLKQAIGHRMGSVISIDVGIITCEFVLNLTCLCTKL
jgi:hypothetical protein